MTTESPLLILNYFGKRTSLNGFLPESTLPWLLMSSECVSLHSINMDLYYIDEADTFAFGGLTTAKNLGFQSLHQGLRWNTNFCSNNESYLFPDI